MESDNNLFGGRIVRWFLLGSAIGIVLVFGLYMAIALAGGAETGSAIGVGLFTGFWGGIGFGGMLGAVLGAATALEAHDARETSATNEARKAA